MKSLTVSELVTLYLKTRTTARRSTQNLHSLVKNYLASDNFGSQHINDIKTSDAKFFFLSLENAGKGYCTIHNFRSVLHPAFQMAVDDDIIVKNPFAFPLTNVIAKSSSQRVALTQNEEHDFLEYLQADECFRQYYDAVYVLLHTGLRISEFCGLTVEDISFQDNVIHVTKQLKRYSNMEFALEETKTASGKRDFPMTDELHEAFQRIVAKAPVYDGNTSKNPLFAKAFLFRDTAGLPFTAFRWDKLFQRMTRAYNDVHKKPLPRLTPHVCRHTFCTRMACAGMNPKVLQYLMGHSDISITLNVYTHLQQNDARRELLRVRKSIRSK